MEIMAVHNLLATPLLAIPPLVQWLIGILGTGLLGYQTVKGGMDTNRQLRMQEKSLSMEDEARKAQLESDKVMNKQKKSMTEKYMAEAERSSSRDRQMQMLQMMMQERQGNNAMAMNAMGSAMGAMDSSRPDPRYITSLMQ
jgi:hypothetical protein